ncbi:hypothetical protein D3C83_69310 [compost metagenome]
MDKLRRELEAVIQSPETQKRLMADAAVPMVMSRADMRRMIHNDVKKWREVAKSAGIKVN